MNVKQLRKLAVEVGITPSYRALAWQVLCGVLPPFQSLWSTAKAERQEMLDDLMAGAQILRLPESESDDENANASIATLSLLRIYWSQVMMRPPLVGMNDAHYIQSIEAVLHSVLHDTPMQFWCLVSILRVLDQAFDLLDPSLSIDQFYEIDVTEFEAQFLRALECTKGEIRL